jgi:hypothetical protein
MRDYLDPFWITPPHLKAFGPQKIQLPFNFFVVPVFLPSLLPSSNLQHISKRGCLLLENNRSAHLTIDNIAILSPNHRLKPPSSTLTLTENDYGRKH